MERQIITNINQIKSGDLSRIAHDVSGMVDLYNAAHPFEMLPKPPEVVVEQLGKGYSVLITTKEESPIVLFHGSLYPNFENGEEKLLGCQVIECGSWIANPDHRGEGLATLGVSELIKSAKELYDDENPPLILATHKRFGALKVSGHVGLSAIDYNEHPYLSYLTCTCTNCSEAHGFTRCAFRRSTPNVEVVGEGGKIDCTLVVSDVRLAKKFEDKCRTLHSQIGKPLEAGIISADSMTRAKEFFQWIKNA